MQQSHLRELDGIRAISILLVLAAHMLPLGPSQFGLNAMAGAMGMSLFFCLSGFLITKFLAEKDDVADFFRRRFARITPAVTLYAAIVAVLLFGRWDAFLATALFYINYDDTALNVPAMGHLWSLSVEVQFYVAIGLCVWLMGKRALWLIPIAALFVMILRISSGTYVSIRTHLRVDEILVGGILAIAWLQHDERLNAWLGKAALPVLLTTLALWPFSAHEAGGPIGYARPYLAMAIVGSVIFMPDNACKRSLTHPWLAFVAAISYALYIWHPATMLGWLGEGDKLTLYLVKRPISFALTLGLAYLSTMTVERYFRSLARHKSFVSS